MKTSIVKKLNSKGRISLTKEFCDYTKIKLSSRVAICKGKNENEVYILNIEDVNRNNEIISFANIDYKARLLIPEPLREATDMFFEVLVINKKIILRAVKTKSDH